MKKILTFCFYRNIIFLICFGFLYLPMLILVIYSFNVSPLMFTWKNFSFHWYLVLFNDNEMIKAMTCSIYIACITATTAVLLGLSISFINIHFSKFFGSNIFYFMFTGMLVIPDIVNGLSLMLLFVTLNYFINWPGNNGIITIWLAHTTFCTAYTTILIHARLRDQDTCIEEAAMDLGANPLQVFLFITLPLIFPAIFVSWLLAFSLSLDDLVVASFVTRPGTVTLPIQIFSMVRRGMSPEINALSTIILFVVGIISFIVWKFMLKNNVVITKYSKKT